jgi:IPT/TIG domain
MGLYNAAGNRIAKADVDTDEVAVPAGDVEVTVNENYYESFRLPGETSEEGTGRRLKFREGSRHKQSDIDAAFAAGSISTVSPSSGAAAGGTAVTISGTSLDGATGATFGGDPGTAFSVEGNDTVKVTTPAHAAGAVNVVVNTPSGPVTKTGGFTYNP